jgi:protein SMG6
MDDRILNIAAFQQEHFVDRSTILGGRKGGVEATKVVLVTFDRNLRLKARARGVDAADEKEMAGIMGKV